MRIREVVRTTLFWIDTIDLPYYTVADGIDTIDLTYYHIDVCVACRRRLPIAIGDSA